ncbi:MAG: recombination protein RecR [Phycisphaeraceae bacterium]|nr:recombination protein RecR [Phycisphaeraceae bacterium]
MGAAGSLSTFERLVEQLARLPGFGRRSAQRAAFHLLKEPAEQAMSLASAISDLKQKVRQCASCFNLSESQPCPICADPQRDHGTILVVEEPSEVVTIEATATYRGLYHVLMGRLAPLNGVGPGELNIDALLERVRRESVREVILATNPTIEGDTTALYLAEKLQATGASVSRLARGMPTGSNLEMVSKAVLTDAIHGRQIVS